MQKQARWIVAIFLAVWWALGFLGNLQTAQGLFENRGEIIKLIGIALTSQWLPLTLFLAGVSAIVWTHWRMPRREARKGPSEESAPVLGNKKTVRRVGGDSCFQDASNQPTPEDIIRDIGAAHPLQRALTAKRFQGLVIDWQVQLEAIYPNDDGIFATLRFSRGENVSFPVIQCLLRIASYPDLQVAREGSIFRMQASIEKANEFEIWTRDATLTLIKGVFHRG
jgi:hypothetical protein